MTRTALALPLATIVLLMGAPSGRAADQHVVLTPDQIKWQPAPPALPKGAEIAVLSGDPGKEGPFVLRAKLPASYRIGPHTHPTAENITVLSGTLNLGEGKAMDPEKMRPVSAGAFFSMPAGMAHYVSAKDETIIQVSSMGPFAITYVNPQDDPRQAAGAAK